MSIFNNKPASRRAPRRGGGALHQFIGQVLFFFLSFHALPVTFLRYRAGLDFMAVTMWKEIILAVLFLWATWNVATSKVHLKTDTLTLLILVVWTGVAVVLYGLVTFIVFIWIDPSILTSLGFRNDWSTFIPGEALA